LHSKQYRALPQPPKVVGKAWGEGLEEEFNTIKGFEVEDTLGNEVEVEDDEIIEGGSEGSSEGGSKGDLEGGSEQT
jgi:hypothetical protein